MSTKRTSKLVALLITLAMVIGIMPIAVFADNTIISNVSATVTAPVTGVNPDMVIASGNPDKYEVKLGHWCLMVSSVIGGPELTTADTFIAGERYGVYLTFIAKEGYAFGSAITVEINGQTASNNGNNAKTAYGSLVFTLPGTSPFSFVHNTQYDIPSTKIGDIYTSASLAATGGTKKSSFPYYNYTIVTPVPGLSYSELNGRLSYSRSEAAPATTAQIAARDKTGAKQTITIHIGAVTDPSVPEPTALTSISATVTAPVAGATPDYSASSADSGKYTAEVSEWRRGNALPDSVEMAASDTFQANSTYWAEVCFSPKTGYDLKSSTAVINDKTATDRGYSASSAEHYYAVSFTVPAAAIPVSDFEITDLTAPVHGVAADYTASVSPVGFTVAEVRYAIDGTNVNPYTGKAGDKLSIGVVVRANDRYTFASNSQLTATCIGLIFKTAIKPVSLAANERLFIFEYTVPATPTELTFADNAVYDIPTGEAGTTYTSTTALTATGGTSPYTFTIDGTAPAGLSINTDNKLMYARPATATAATIATVKVTDGASATKTITINIGAVTATTVIPEMSFIDVPEDAYYKDPVIWAVDEGITEGTSATTFSPNAICTRAQAVTFLWRAGGSPAPKTTAMPFRDVPAGSYYYVAVLWAVEQGIIKGTSAMTFSPNMNCSRAQIVTMLWRMEGCKTVMTPSPFADVKSSAYYADAVLWAVEREITMGVTATTFCPDINCTRAQIVTFIYRDMQ